MTAPTLAPPSVPQHMVALQRANWIRDERGKLRREVEQLSRKGGADRVAALLLNPPEVVETMMIFDLLRWVDRIGRSQARAILRRADPLGWPISERNHISRAPNGVGCVLTARQREALAEHLRDALAGHLRGVDS